VAVEFGILEEVFWKAHFSDPEGGIIERLVRLCDAVRPSRGLTSGGATEPQTGLCRGGGERTMVRMMVLFEVFLAPGADPSTLLTQETQRETNAQVMTIDDARKVGFQGVPDPPQDKEVRLIAVARRDAPWIHRVLETNVAVGAFRTYEID